jgi:hypothetical protein
MNESADEYWILNHNAAIGPAVVHTQGILPDASAIAIRDRVARCAYPRLIAQPALRYGLRVRQWTRNSVGHESFGEEIPDPRTPQSPMQLPPMSDLQVRWPGRLVQIDSHMVGMKAIAMVKRILIRTRHLPGRTKGIGVKNQRTLLALEKTGVKGDLGVVRRDHLQ